jgi:hypothetical protein
LISHQKSLIEKQEKEFSAIIESYKELVAYQKMLIAKYEAKKGSNDLLDNLVDDSNKQEKVIEEINSNLSELVQILNNRDAEKFNDSHNETDSATKLMELSARNSELLNEIEQKNNQLLEYRNVINGLEKKETKMVVEAKSTIEDFDELVAQSIANVQQSQFDISNCGIARADREK